MFCDFLLITKMRANVLGLRKLQVQIWGCFSFVFFVSLLLHLYLYTPCNPQEIISVSNVEKHTDKEELFKSWVETYKSPNPKHQTYCHNILKTTRGSSSQFEQDVFLFMNLFKYWPMEGKRGVYVDSGANDAKFLSNTYFFDVCLGWAGLCIEPMTEYHDGIRRERTCTLIPECISSKSSVLKMKRLEALSEISEQGEFSVQCNTLKSMLSTHKIESVDLWSLDVEGYEMQTLKAIGDVPISVILVESFWISAKMLDLHLTRKGFIKYHEMAIDSLFVNRSFTVNSQVWYPDMWDKFINSNVDYRNQPDIKSRLKTL